MTIIYKDFAKELDELNYQTDGDNCVSTPMGRAYQVDGKTYYDNVYFKPVSESWMSHEWIRKGITAIGDYQGGVYMGAAGENNLHYIVASRAPAAILFDINPWQQIFWTDFLNLVAVCPNREDLAMQIEDFAKGFYFKLSRVFDIAAIKSEHPYIDMSSPDPKDDLGRTYSSLSRERSSPVLNMRYKDFFEHFGTALGMDTGFIFCGDQETHWLANEDNYRHLHLMAKNKAIGALTLDVCDETGCQQLRDWLDDVSYTPVNAEKPSGEKGAIVQTGADIGMLYLSNIAHYLDWSEEEIDDQLKAGKAAKDFTQRTVETNKWKKAAENLRPLMAENARIIRFDKGGGGGPWSQFGPSFEIADKPENIRLPNPRMEAGLTPHP